MAYVLEKASKEEQKEKVVADIPKDSEHKPLLKKFYQEQSGVRSWVIDREIDSYLIRGPMYTVSREGIKAFIFFYKGQMYWIQRDPFGVYTRSSHPPAILQKIWFTHDLTIKQEHLKLLSHDELDELKTAIKEAFFTYGHFGKGQHPRFEIEYRVYFEEDLVK